MRHTHTVTVLASRICTPAPGLMSIVAPSALDSFDSVLRLACRSGLPQLTGNNPAVVAVVQQ